MDTRLCDIRNELKRDNIQFPPYFLSFILYFSIHTSLCMSNNTKLYNHNEYESIQLLCMWMQQKKGTNQSQRREIDYICVMELIMRSKNRHTFIWMNAKRKNKRDESSTLLRLFSFSVHLLHTNSRIRFLLSMPDIESHWTNFFFICFSSSNLLIFFPFHF